MWNNSHHPDDVEPALDASLKDLGTDYVDLYLMHWPSPFARGKSSFPKDEAGKVRVGESDYVDTYKAMEKLYKSGKAKAIGVSNFSKAELERLLKETSVVCIDSFHQFLWLEVLLTTVIGPGCSPDRVPSLLGST